MLSCFTLFYTSQGFYEIRQYLRNKKSRKTLTSNPLETHIPIAVRPRVGVGGSLELKGAGRKTNTAKSFVKFV